MKITNKFKKIIVWALTIIVLVLTTLLISFTSIHHVRGEELRASDVEQYYLLTDDNYDFQTFQFQPCRVMSYSVVGQIIGKKTTEDKFKIDKITFKAHILNGSIFHINNGLRITEPSYEINHHSKTLEFHYKLDFYDKNDLDSDRAIDTLRLTNEEVIVDENYRIGFFPSTDSIALELYCEIEATFSAAFVPGGGYECDGIGVIKP